MHVPAIGASLLAINPVSKGTLDQHSFQFQNIIARQKEQSRRSHYGLDFFELRRILDNFSASKDVLGFTKNIIL